MSKLDVSDYIDLDDLIKEEADFSITLNKRVHKFRHTLLNNNEEEQKLEDRRQELIAESEAIIWEGTAPNRVPRQQTDEDKARIEAINAEYNLWLPKLFCMRITQWPYRQAGELVPLTPEAVYEKFKFNAQYLNHILAWSNAARYPKPGMASN